MASTNAISVNHVGGVGELDEQKVMKKEGQRSHVFIEQGYHFVNPAVNP